MDGATGGATRPMVIEQAWATALTEFAAESVKE
jgi:hypothetical protein